MIQFNYHGVFKLLIAAFIAILFVGVITGHASAAENESFVVVDYGYGTPLNYIPRIAQGDTVYLNDTVDISGATGWRGPDGEFRIAYYGQWVTSTTPAGLEPIYILELPGLSRSGTTPTQYAYYVDPDIFYDKPGWWFQFYSNTSSLVKDEDAGNLRAFYVSSKKRYVTASNNTTEVFLAGNYTEKKIAPEPLLPEKRISDILVAKGDAPDLPVIDGRVWVFGRVDGIYGKPSNLTIDDIWGLEPGTYTVMLQYPGKNTIYDVTYDGMNKLVPGLYGEKYTDVTAARSSASVMQQKFMEMVRKYDDRIYSYRMEVEHPYITLDRIDEKYLNGTTIMDIRGYTNAAPGTVITATLDEGRSYKSYIAQRTVVTTAVRSNPGHLSYYQAILPIDYDSLSAADARNHTITAKTAIGGVVFKDFWISILPADSFKPNATIKYVEGRNPFVPLPTPIVEVVEKEVTKEVIKTVTVEVPPSQEQVDEANMKAMSAMGQMAILVAAVFATGFVVIRFIYRAWMRRRWMKR